MKLLYSFYGPVKRSETLPILFRLTGNGITMLILIRNYKLENPLQLPQFTMATIRGITKKNLLLTQSPEVNARTNTPPDVITPLHPVLPADIAEIPTAQTVMKHFPMVIPFPHTVMTMTTALSLQNQLQKLMES